jgi:hypothetical protein
MTSMPQEVITTAENKITIDKVKVIVKVYYHANKTTDYTQRTTASSPAVHVLAQHPRLRTETALKKMR